MRSGQLELESDSGWARSEGVSTMLSTLSHLHGISVPTQVRKALESLRRSRTEMEGVAIIFSPFQNSLLWGVEQVWCSQRTEWLLPRLSLPSGCLGSLSCQPLGEEQFREKLGEKFLLIREHC